MGRYRSLDYTALLRSGLNGAAVVLLHFSGFNEAVSATDVVSNALGFPLGSMSVNNTYIGPQQCMNTTYILRWAIWSLGVWGFKDVAFC